MTSSPTSRPRTISMVETELRPSSTGTRTAFELPGSSRNSVVIEFVAWP